VAPAMNNHMYEHPATQANLNALRSRGVSVIEPDSGRLASLGEEGVGRLAEPERLLATCEALLASSGRINASVESPAAEGRRLAEAWRGLRVLVTAGGTREPIDSVRFVGNSSSGRMGIALANAAHRRGAEVTLVAANVERKTPSDVRVVRVGTVAELEDACEREFPACDVLLMAAAVADFRPARPAAGKIKKGGRDHLAIELEPTADVLCGLASKRRPEQTLVAFAAEHGPDAVEHARAKRSAKGVDAVVVNDISRADIGFESPANEVTIVTEAGEEPVPLACKDTVAESILDAVERLRSRA
jgi:phosphopantothenoylcysteine decarboxylase / phosphopantothenate---cysteine ligase